MRKYTDTELSLLLSEHCARNMARVGCMGISGLFCAEQTVHNSCSPWPGKQPDRIYWFDGEYEEQWSAEQYLRAMEKAGLA